jgi:HEPN domain-containing protein
MAYAPQKIIDTANSFLLAAERALEQRPLGPDQFQMLLVPAVVSTAFAVELYFKGIITLENGKARGHDLSELFERLSTESQATLVAKLQFDRQTFDQKLKVISSIFVEWRYIFEQQSAYLDFSFLDELAKESKRVAEGMANLSA